MTVYKKFGSRLNPPFFFFLTPLKLNQKSKTTKIFRRGGQAKLCFNRCLKLCLNRCLRVKWCTKRGKRVMGHQMRGPIPSLPGPSSHISAFLFFFLFYLFIFNFSSNETISILLHLWWSRFCPNCCLQYFWINVVLQYAVPIFCLNSF